MTLVRAIVEATTSGPRCWLMKSEPDSFSIDDLERVQRTAWEGVRNYQARIHMRDDMKVGDAILFYHSNAEPPAVVGLARVASAPYPDASAFDPKSPYFDAKSKREEPRWILVDVAFVEKLATPVPLDRLREDPALNGMLVAQKGQRLSVQPVLRAHFEHVARIAGATRLAELLG
jgi:predicted RNA-binding protein with PUA-like domain